MWKYFFVIFNEILKLEMGVSIMAAGKILFIKRFNSNSKITFFEVAVCKKLGILIENKMSDPNLGNWSFTNCLLKIRND